MIKTTDSLLKIAIQSSIEAGKAIMEIYSTPFEVEIKDDDSPLTIADKNANSIINSFLEKTDIPIISEENRQLPYSERKKWTECWIVDPLDGTKEFIKRNGEFTVNIAKIKDGKPEFGIIYIPVTKLLYVGLVAEKKAYLIRVESEDTAVSDLITTAIPIKPNSNLDIIRIVGSRSHLNKETTTYVSKLSESYKTEMVAIGSSLKFCLIAEGNADLYPRFAPTMEWDTAAGQAICEAVDIMVLDMKTKKPMRYNKPNLLNNHFIVLKDEKLAT